MCRDRHTGGFGDERRELLAKSVLRQRRVAQIAEYLASGNGGELVFVADQDQAGVVGQRNAPPTPPRSPTATMVSAICPASSFQIAEMLLPYPCRPTCARTLEVMSSRRPKQLTVQTASGSNRHRLGPFGAR